ncbi:hypothetical protein [Lutibacter sp.]|uniref:hypothetical protein n=1 Tax=Lutibacter sp. TaxID=1925666 RepID=UPI0025BD945D|nr:hypothetical protein [Lutibacter sp.]MCF6169198.1 hypothetical protein [Lutibacter sp.]
MKQESKKGNQISRRGMLPILGSTLLIPFLGFGKPLDDNIISEENEEYQTLLKPDGSTVKVKINTLKKSKIIKKNISNKALLNWLGRKL